MHLSGAMAHQCFNNEYIFHQSQLEIKYIDQLEQDLLHKTEDLNLLMVYAMYRPIHRHPAARRFFLWRIRRDHKTRDHKNAYRAT